MMTPYRIANAQHHASSQRVELVHTIDDFALEVLREMSLFSSLFCRLIEFLDEIERLHLWSLQRTKFVCHAIQHRDLDLCIGCENKQKSIKPKWSDVCVCERERERETERDRESMTASDHRRSYLPGPRRQEFLQWAARTPPRAESHPAS
jgi:hypothetical protein